MITWAAYESGTGMVQHSRDAGQVIFEDLGLCGCGDPCMVVAFVVEALRLLALRWEADSPDEARLAVRRHFRDDPEGEMDDLFYMLAWYFIDRAGLIEHGGGVGGSWPTEKGKAFLAFMVSPEGKQWLRDQEWAGHED